MVDMPIRHMYATIAFETVTRLMRRALALALDIHTYIHSCINLEKSACARKEPRHLRNLATCNRFTFSQCAQQVRMIQQHDIMLAKQEENDAQDTKKKVMFGSRWLCQAKKDGWDSEELAKLSLLEKKMLIIDNASFEMLLIKSGVIDCTFLAKLVEEDENALEGSNVLHILHESDKENFFENYEEALSTAIITLEDFTMATQLYDIVEKNSYDQDQVHQL